jgi:hypothetical protein
MPTVSRFEGGHRERNSAPQDRDAQRPAELGAGLRDRRCRPGPLRRSCPDGQVGGQGDDRRQGQGEDDRAGHQHRQASGAVQQDEQAETDGRQQEAASDHQPQAQAAHQPWISMDPTTNATTWGSIHRPACSGDMPAPNAGTGR